MLCKEDMFSVVPPSKKEVATLVDETKLASPGRIKSRRHRRAMRRTHSSMDSSPVTGVPPSECSRRSSSSSPRHSQVVPRPPGRNRLLHVRHHSLPETESLGRQRQDRTTQTQAGGRRTQVVQPQPVVEKEASSHSSYKETSSDTERVTPVKAKDAERTAKSTGMHSKHPNVIFRARANPISADTFRNLKIKGRHRSRSDRSPKASASKRGVPVKTPDRPRSQSLVDTDRGESGLRASQRSKYSNASTITSSTSTTGHSPTFSFSSRKSSLSDDSSELSDGDDYLLMSLPPKLHPVLQLQQRLQTMGMQSESNNTLTEPGGKLPGSDINDGGPQKVRSHGNGNGRPGGHFRLARMSGMMRSFDDNHLSLGAENQSRQSSIVGLDWLFSTDTSDSASSGKRFNICPLLLFLSR